MIQMMCVECRLCRPRRATSYLLAPSPFEIQRQYTYFFPTCARKQGNRYTVSGLPAEAPLAVFRGRHRFRLLVKAPKEVDLQACLKTWLDALAQPKGDLRIQVDVDPYDFL